MYLPWPHQLLLSLGASVLGPGWGGGGSYLSLWAVAAIRKGEVPAYSRPHVSFSAAAAVFFGSWKNMKEVHFSVAATG